MKRLALENIINWNNKSNRKPLIVWGARQVGKTYLIRDIFAQNYYPNNYIYIDCSDNLDFSEFVSSHSAKDILNYLSLEYGRTIDKNTLLIFDEAQECLPLISSLKQFCQNYPEIPIILTGSMVRIKLNRQSKDTNRNFLFPVGKINELTIYPLSFEEYLLNRNEIAYDFLINNFKEFKPIDEGLHNIILKIFYEYLIIGGMPEVVDSFIKNESYPEALEILHDLYDNYLADMNLYQASKKSIIRSKNIFNNIFNLLNRESKNFSPSVIEEKTRNRDYISSLDWLETAFLVTKSYQVKENTSIPLLPSNESIFRLYLSDMGMFTYQSKQPLTTFIDRDSKNTLSRVFFENYVALELIKNNYDLYYWKGKRNAEFEFLIQYKNSVVPVDVKKSKGKLNSLDEYKTHNKYAFAIKISNNNFGYDEAKKIITLPYYSLFLLLKELKKHESILR